MRCCHGLNRRIDNQSIGLISTAPMLVNSRSIRTMFVITLGSHLLNRRQIVTKKVCGISKLSDFNFLFKHRSSLEINTLLLNISSAVRMNQYGESGHPCLTPVDGFN